MRAHRDHGYRPSREPGNRAESHASTAVPRWAADGITQASTERGAAGRPADSAWLAALGMAHLRHDQAADNSARLLGANAVTVGTEVQFRRGHFAPGTTTGRTLIAHEVAHIVQQVRTGSATPQRAGASDSLSASITEAMAEAMSSAELDRQITLLRSHLARHPGDNGPAANLAVLEGVTQRRQGTATEPAATGASPVTTGGGAPVSPAATGDGAVEEQHGSLWWALHRVGLMETRHERADLLRRAWGSQSHVIVTGRDGEPIEVELLSDDEVIELDRQIRGLPIGRPVAVAGAGLTAAQGGEIIEWGTSNSAEAVAKTEAATSGLSTPKIQEMMSKGLTKEWVLTNLAKYEKAVAAGGQKLSNAQLLPRLKLMRRLVELWP